MQHFSEGERCTCVNIVSPEWGLRNFSTYKPTLHKYSVRSKNTGWPENFFHFENSYLFCLFVFSNAWNIFFYYDFFTVCMNSFTHYFIESSGYKFFYNTKNIWLDFELSRLRTFRWKKLKFRKKKLIVIVIFSYWMIVVT